MNFNVVNEIKLSYSRKGNCERIILSSKDAVNIFREHFDSEEIDYRESFFTIYLNQANKVLDIKKISESGISSIRLMINSAVFCPISGAC